MTAAFLAGAVAIGFLLAIQASVNPQLATAVGTPYGGSTVQLWVAVAVLAIVAMAVGAFGPLGLLGTVPGWYLLGGLASPLYITSGILLFPRVGALAAAGLFVTGQVLASVALDLFGLFGIERRPVTLGLVAGAVAVLVGIAVVIGARRVPAAETVPVASVSGGTPPPRHAVRSSRIEAGWIALGLAAGAVLPFQGAINARLRGALVNPIAVALTSFVVAALAITIVLLVLRATGRTPAPKLSGVRTMPWWGWLGGACAAAYVTGTFLLIPVIGAAVTVALTVTGQQLAAAVIDARGAFRLPRRPVTAVRASGLVLLVVGCALVELL